MKLSKATRSLLAANTKNSDDNDDCDNDNNNEETEDAHTAETEKCIRSKSQYVHATTPESPEGLDISTMSINHSFEARGRHCFNTNVPSTPPTNVVARNAGICSVSSTPPTPDLGTTFATCSLQEVTCSLHPAIMADFDGPESYAFKKNGSVQKPAYDSDDEVVTGPGFSPPRMAKVLQPRQEEDNWIPLVEDQDWEAAPMSLKLQVCYVIPPLGIMWMHLTISML